MTFLVQWIADALSLYILDILFEGITFSQNKDIIITALLLMLVNAIIKPILKLLSLPLTIITFGLFSFIVNAIVLEITFNLASGASINSFGTALINPAISNFFDKK